MGKIEIPLSYIIPSEPVTAIIGYYEQSKCMQVILKMPRGRLVDVSIHDSKYHECRNTIILRAGVTGDIVRHKLIIESIIHPIPIGLVHPSYGPSRPVYKVNNASKWK